MGLEEPEEPGRKIGTNPLQRTPKTSVFPGALQEQQQDLFSLVAQDPKHKERPALAGWVVWGEVGWGGVDGVVGRADGWGTWALGGPWGELIWMSPCPRLGMAPVQDRFLLVCSCANEVLIQRCCHFSWVPLLVCQLWLGSGGFLEESGGSLFLVW